MNHKLLVVFDGAQAFAAWSTAHYNTVIRPQISALVQGVDLRLQRRVGMGKAVGLYRDEDDEPEIVSDRIGYVDVVDEIVDRYVTANGQATIEFGRGKYAMAANSVNGKIRVKAR